MTDGGYKTNWDITLSFPFDIPRYFPDFVLTKYEVVTPRPFRNIIFYNAYEFDKSDSSM